MAVDSNLLKGLISNAFPEAQIELKDLLGDQDHYSLKITSSQFEGKSRIQQHQMVYAALDGRMGNELHALSIQTAIPTAKEN